MSSVDAEDLIARLSGGLAPTDRAAFRKAAEAALATQPECSGEGSVYRVVAKLWRSYFHPPQDTTESGWYERRNRPASRLISEEAPRHRHRARGLLVVG
jgi:hypothetical protein